MEESIRSGSVRWPWVLVFTLVTIALVAGAYAYYISETERIRQEKHQEIAAIGELKAGQIQAWRQERLRDTLRVSKAPFFKRAVEEWIRDPEDSALQKELLHRLEIEQNEEGYADVLLLSTEGHFILSSTLDPQPLHPITKKVIEEALAKRAPLLSDLYRSSRGIVHLDAVAPILDTEGKLLAVLVLRTNAETYLYPLIQSWPTPSRTAESLLVRREGDGILFLNDIRHRPNSAFSLRQPLTLQELPAVQAVLGRRGIFEGKDYRGVEVLADLRAIPDSPWFMVAKVDAAEIWAEARYRGAVTALFVGLFLLFAAGVTAYGYRRKQVLLYRNLYQSERQTREAQGEFRTTLYSIGDAVITTDTEGLVKQMNPVAERITGWEEAQAKGRPLSEVFHIVNEESGREVENPVQRVLREGTVVGLANHTLLVAKDGSRRPIADSGAPIRDESGAIIGVVLVFRDQTEERAAQEALRASESFLNSVIDQSPNPMWISDHQGTLIRTNKALRDLLHISDEEVIGKYNILSDNIVEEQGALPLVRNVFERGDAARFEITYDTSQLQQLQLTESAFVILDVSIFPIKDSDGNITNAVIQHIDITERERAEENLKHSEERYRHLVEMSLDGIAVHQDGAVVFANPAAAKMIGADSPDELLRQPIQKFVRPDCWEATRTRIQRMLRGETGLYPVEDWYVKLDGTSVPVEVTASALTYGGKPAVQVVARDITERKRAEAALRTSEAQLSNALEMAHLGHWEYDVVKDVFTFNDHFYKIFRTTAEEVGGYTMSSAEYARRFVHPEDISVVADETRKAIETDDPGFSRQLEHRMLYADGEIGYISVRFFIVKDDLGRTVRTYGVNQDITERMKAEQAVRESEERYRLLFRNMLEGYAYCRMLFEDGAPRDFVYLAVNEAFETLTGLKSVVGKKVTEVIPGIRESNPELFEVYGRVALTGRPEKLETYVEPLGIWLSVSVYSTESERFVAVFENITERKQAEKKLRQAEGRYRSLFEDAPLMYVITRNDQGVPFVMDCNEVFLESVGYSREAVVGQPLADFYSPESRVALLEGGGYARALAGEFHMGERQLLARDGRLIPTLLYTATEVDPSGQVIGTRAMFVDITERRKAEAALQFERQQLLSIFESINEVILVIDPRTYEILYANRYAEELYGKSLVGGRCYENLRDSERPCGHCLNEKVMSLQGKPYQWEYHSNALNRDFLATDRIIRWPDGRDVKFQLAIDITERNRAEVEKENLSSQLLQAQKMEAVGTLAGGVAHDFNNLLQVVLGYSELILDDGQFPSQYKEDLARINQAARNGADLVQRLLTFSRKTEVKPRPLNLNRRIEQLQKMLSRTIPRMIEIELILASDLAAINADPTQMEQVLMNLAVNARDAMPEGGKLTIQTENVTLDEHYSRSHLDTKPGRYVMLSVADTGRGMDKETVQHIFEPFFSTKGPGEGTGLGLAMVYGIVKQHGGHIMCYSEPSQGTIFRMYFPALVSEETPLETTCRVMPKGGSETILIVDDEELVRDLGARILTKAGYKVIGASNGKEALKMYQENRDEISLILLDLIMPEMGGKQCLEELLSINPQVKVLIASGYSADGSTKESTEIGARGFVAKPYDVRQLLETVRNVLDS